MVTFIYFLYTVHHGFGHTRCQSDSDDTPLRECVHAI